MLKLLAEVEYTLPNILEQEDNWNDLLVTYNKPHVHRLWYRWNNETRVLLHKIHACEDSEALLHPHPWPAAMKVFVPEGTDGYETAVGWGHPEGDAPPMPAKFVLQSESSYEMLNYQAWHYVRPIDGPIYSLMVTGAPFLIPKQDRFGQFRQHGHLSDEQRADLFAFFRGRYS